MRNSGLQWTIGALAALAAGPVLAGGASDWVDTAQSQVRLVAAADAVGTGDSVRLGLQFRLEPGWKVYWRSPGDAGVPPVLAWQGSHNFAAADIDWPAPHRFNLYGLDTFGYKDEVLLPITVHLARPGQDLTLKLEVTYGICKDVCIPYDAVLTLDLPAGPLAPTAYQPLIDAYAAQVPKRVADPALAIRTARIERIGGKQVLSVTAAATTPFTAPDLVVEGPDGVRFAKPVVSLSDGGATARFQAAVDTAEATKPAGAANVILTLIDGDRAIERKLVLELLP